MKAMQLVSSLSMLVPAPAFLKMPSMGVDISDTSLKYVSLKDSHRPNEAHEIDQWGSIDIPSGVLTGGSIKDPAQLANVLNELKQKTGASFVRLSLPEERAYVFETEIKRGTALKEVRGMLEFRLEENVPIAPRDAFFDYEILTPDPEDKTMRIVVAVYARETIQHYYDACRAAGLTPLSFEVEAQAMARATVQRNDERAHLLVDFGKNRTGIGVVHQGTLMYTSTIDVGGDHLSRALRKHLGEKTPESEITTIKNTQGLVRQVEDPAVYDALLSIASIIKDEISTRLQYWHTRDYKRSERRIASIILCGGSANMKGLPEYLTETVGIRTERGNVWQNVLDLETTIPPIDRRHSYGYAGAIGLVLNDFMKT